MTPPESPDVHAWMRLYYEAVTRRGAFDTLSPVHQFAALLDAIAVDDPARADSLRALPPTEQRGILRSLLDTSRQTAVFQTELWRVQRAGRALRCVAVEQVTGIDLRLMEDNNFRRTILCPDSPAAYAQSRTWQAKLLQAGWQDA